MPMGYPFIFNGVQSEAYNVSLVFIDNSYTNRTSGGDKNVITASIRRNPIKQYLDTEYENVLQFPIEIVFDNAVDIYELTNLKNWLTAPVRYEQLQICAEHFERYYYNCIIHLNEDLIYGDGYRGVSATVECDAPYAHEFERVEKYTLNPDVTKTDTFIFENYSDDFEFMKPILKFHMSTDGNFSINVKHYSDRKYMVVKDGVIMLNNETYDKCTTYCKLNGISISYIEKAVDYNVTTNFSHLNKNDIVYLDNESCVMTLNDTVTSDIFSKFNKKFFKIPRGMNTISVYGVADYMYIVYQNAKRLGGSYY